MRRRDVGEHERGWSGALRGDRREHIQIVMDSVTLLRWREVRGEPACQISCERRAEKADFELIELAAVDPDVGLTSWDLLEARCDRDNVIAEFTHLRESKAVCDGMSDRRLLRLSTVGDLPERGYVFDIVEVECGGHADVGPQVVGVRPRRDAEAALGQLGGKGGVVDPERVIEDVGSRVPVEQDHVNVGGCGWWPITCRRPVAQVGALLQVADCRRERAVEEAEQHSRNEEEAGSLVEEWGQWPAAPSVGMAAG